MRYGYEKLTTEKSFSTKVDVYIEQLSESAIGTHLKNIGGGRKLFFHRKKRKSVLKNRAKKSVCW